MAANHTPTTRAGRVTTGKTTVKKGKRPQQLAKVETDRRKHRVLRVAQLAAQKVAAQTVFAFHVPDDRFDRTAPFPPPQHPPRRAFAGPVHHLDVTKNKNEKMAGHYLWKKS